jgi:hypothetical protein
MTAPLASATSRSINSSLPSTMPSTLPFRSLAHSARPVFASASSVASTSTFDEMRYAPDST